MIQPIDNKFFKNKATGTIQRGGEWRAEGHAPETTEGLVEVVDTSLIGAAGWAEVAAMQTQIINNTEAKKGEFVVADAQRQPLALFHVKKGAAHNVYYIGKSTEERTAADKAIADYIAKV